MAEKANDPDLLDAAVRLAGGKYKLMEMFGVRASYYPKLRAEGLSLPWQYALRWYVKTGRLSPPEDMAEMGIFLDFTARVAGHKQLRKVVLALSDPEEAPIFERALNAATRP